jgi:PAS domain-containing protein
MGLRYNIHSDRLQLGLYTWDVCDNRLIGDELFAALHGLPPHQTAEGVTIEFIINRMVQGDRERTAHEVHKAILSGEFVKSAFRVKAEDGSVRHIGWYGRCLKNRDGVPTHFTGAIFDHTTDVIAVATPAELRLH